MVSVGAVARVASKGIWIKRFFIFTIMFIVFMIIFANAIVQSVQQRSFQPIVDDLGFRWLQTTFALEEESQTIIDQGGVYEANSGFFGSSGQAFFSISGTLGPILIIYVWIRVLMYIAARSPLSGDISQWGNHLAIAVTFFFFLQILILLLFGHGGQSFVIPFRAFWTFFKAIPFILSPMSAIAERFIGEGSNITNVSVPN